MRNEAEPMQKKIKHTLTPKLRFPEFSDAPVWSTPLGDELFEQINNRNARVGLPVLAITQEHGAIPRDQIDYHVSVTEKSVESYKEVCPGDFIISLRSFQGGIEYSNYHGICSPAYVILRGKTEDDAEFFKHLFKSHRFIQHMTRNLEGLRDGKMISFKQFSEVTIAKPEPPEQQKIADCLSSLDGLIAAEGRLLETLKAHKKGLMQQLFPQPGQTQPRLQFPEFRDKGRWESTPLSSFIESLDAGVSVNSGDRPASPDEVGILKTSCVTNGVFEPLENKLVSKVNEIKRLKEPVCGNTIIISRMNTPALVGANAYIADSIKNLFLPDRLWAAKAKVNTSMRFIAFILNSGRGRTALSEMASGTSGSMKNITKTDVLTLKILAPSLPEQQKIADCFTALDTRIAAQAAKIDALKQHKLGLMQRLFPAPEEQ